MIAFQLEATKKLFAKQCQVSPTKREDRTSMPGTTNFRTWGPKKSSLQKKGGSEVKNDHFRN